jgi:hypothetical protein
LKPSRFDPPDPGRQQGRSNPERFACLDCAWRKRGYGARGAHFFATGHRIVFADDPRLWANQHGGTASVDAEPETMTHEGQSRR